MNLRTVVLDWQTEGHADGHNELRTDRGRLDVDVRVADAGRLPRTLHALHGGHLLPNVSTAEMRGERQSNLLFGRKRRVFL
jgi:hypothetical protein